MKFLREILLKNAQYKQLLNDVDKALLPVCCTGLADIHKSAVLAALAEHSGKKILVLTPNEADMTRLCEELICLGVDAISFPIRDYCFRDTLSRSAEYEHTRLDTLSKLLDGHFSVVVAAVGAAVQYTVPPEILRENIFTLCSGQEIAPETLCEKLLSAGYTRAEIVEGKGQFNLRGGILDVFPTGRENPVRMEFFGDEIDLLCEFDTETQRRGENIASVKITPAAELIYGCDELAKKLLAYSSKAKLSDKARRVLDSDIQLLSAELSIAADRYLPAIYPPATLFDYTEAALIAVSENNEMNAALKGYISRINEDIKAAAEDGCVTRRYASLNISAQELAGRLEKAVYIENFVGTKRDVFLKGLINFNLKKIPAWQGDMAVLINDIEYISSIGGKVIILGGSEKSARQISEDLAMRGRPASFNPKLEGLPRGNITVTVGSLQSGFEIPEQRLTVIAAVRGSSKKKKRERKRNDNAFFSLDELHIGDYVVHASHGIGVFAGIHKITSAGITKDYIKITYAKGDVLYVPVTQLDLISKYIGSAESGSVKLNRLGSGEWQKTRARVKKAVKDMAKELTALYAKRQSIKGYAFEPDTPLQREFEERFQYTETEDQLISIRDIKRDMESEVPMDRLLCGDVGFGKTEVALRAAFKCISEGKQCALLVPTTILAMQHFNTTVARFGSMPVEVRLLSRFVSASAQSKTLKELKNGRVDMVIGTHRLISKDVKFKNLGLVIIDEEQRFGVAQKERLKQEYPAVDVLTLSATPIPRTLNMAMSGLRDMSSIEEPPGDRLPVQSYVLEYDDGIIIDALRRELRRNGQAYFLHNRVESIVSRAAYLKERLPEARIEVAHGQMGEQELEGVWKRLTEHEIDILVCTTIIETGVDVPNANTLIIENADRMGLSQLHQLRGRVGRSARRAYAYFCFKKDKQVNEVAEKRLEAIREFTEFGAGFKIALRDLEIRGAGNILGGEQHGNMESVGYDLYIKLLNDAINEEKGIKTVDDAECVIDLKISAHIPERYIPSLPARLGIYKRIAATLSAEDKSDIIDELIDRFGEPPKAVLGLIDIALLRNKAARLCISEITEHKNGVRLNINEMNEAQIAAFTSGFGTRFCVAAEEKPYFTVKYKAGQTRAELIAEMADIL